MCVCVRVRVCACVRVCASNVGQFSCLQTFPGHEESQCGALVQNSCKALCPRVHDKIPGEM